LCPLTTAGSTVRYFVITDGERWEVYDMKEMGGELMTTANLSGLIRTR
jgi:predicted type IV restriction endonuclease